MNTAGSVTCKQITLDFIKISMNSITSKANICKNRQTDYISSNSVLDMEDSENKFNRIETDVADSDITDTSVSKMKSLDAKVSMLELFKNEQPNKIDDASTKNKTPAFQDLQVEKKANVDSNKLLSSLKIIPGKNFGGKYSRIVVLADETFQGLQEQWPANTAAIPDWIYSHRLKLLEIKPILEEYCDIHLPRGGKLFVIAMVRFEEKLAYIPSSACKKKSKQHPVLMKEVTTVDVANPVEQFVDVINSIKGLPCAEIDLVFTPVVPSNLCKIQEKLIYTHAKFTKHLVTTPEVMNAAYKSCYDYMQDCLKLNQELCKLCLTGSFSSFSKWKIFSWEKKAFNRGHDFDPDSIPMQRNGRFMLEEIFADTAFQLCKFVNEASAPSSGCMPLSMPRMQKVEDQKVNALKCTFTEIVFLLDPKMADLAKYWPTNFPLKTSFEITAHKLCPSVVKEMIRRKYQGDDLLFIYCPSVKNLLQINQLDECRDHLKLKYPACQNDLASSLFCNKFLSQLKLLRSLLEEDFPHSSVCFTTLHCVDFTKFIPNLIVKHANATAHSCKDYFTEHFINQHNDCFRQAVTTINKGIVSMNTEAVPISFDVCEFVNTRKVDGLFDGLHLNESALQILSENLLLNLRKCNVQSLKTTPMAMHTANSSCNQSSRSRSPSLNKRDSTLKRQSLKTEKYSSQKIKISHRSCDVSQIQYCPTRLRQNRSPHLLTKLSPLSSNLRSRLGKRPSQITEIHSGSSDVRGQSPIQCHSPPMLNCSWVHNRTPQMTNRLLLSNSRSSPVRHLTHPTRTRSPPMRTRSPPMRTRSPPMRTRSPPMRTRSPPTRARSPPTRARSPPTRARSPPMRCRSSPMRCRSSPIRSRSSPMRSRSPPMRSRSPPTPCQFPNRRSPPERRCSFYVDDSENSIKNSSAHFGKQMLKKIKMAQKLESYREPIATPHDYFLGNMSSDNDPKTRTALNMLSKFHCKECAMYRSQPNLHPDYEKEKALFFEKTNLCLDKRSRPSLEDLTKQFRDYWRNRMEEIFYEDWVKKKNICSAMIARDNSHPTRFKESAHVVGPEKLDNLEKLPRVNNKLLLKSIGNTSDDAYTNTELLRKIDAVLKKSEHVLNRGTTNIYLSEAGHEISSFTKSRLNDQIRASSQCAQESFDSKFNVCVDHLPPVNVDSGKERVEQKRLNSVTTLPTQVSFDVIESLRILSQMHDQFGMFSLPLSIILNSAIAAQMNNRDVLQIFDDQEREVLKLCLLRLTELRASNLSFVQKVIIDEAFDRLEFLLLRISESKDPMFAIDVEELSQELKNLDPSQAICRIKQIVVSKGYSFVKDGQILRIYMTQKSQCNS